MKVEIVFEFTDESDIEESTIDSLIIQINEVIAAAVEEKQIEIPNVEIVDYGVGTIIEW